ncbi:MAG: hypothetical protein CBC12_07500 [Candidatus Puniceispirillum sp. TMED52]|jgi:hypothetical protein|nr:MAG: hypothetical protein CBC12_07500 [Candidatus Puniceispirillum sp. TMED52]RPF82040.1 MAG: hypothetical protein CBC65_001520 [Rhodothermaceae bacterium TMED105]|tara:strand:+ start:653 stop:1654 length:1002 start_codon:yes stop_codon:yes gene_type:complete
MQENAAEFPMGKLRIDKPRFPDNVELSERSLGKGSNNKVFAVRVNGEKMILRAPRRRSDTQQAGSALWEFRQTLRASQLDISPKLLNAFYAKHAMQNWTSGLYLVMERYDCNLEEAITDSRTKRQLLMNSSAAVAKEIGKQVVQCLEKLANDLMFVYDLKPSNIVVSLGDDASNVKARVVDFGRDFCEWDTQKNDPEARIPIITGLRQLITNRENNRKERGGDVESILKHVLFAVMLIQLAATSTNNLYEDRDHHRLCEEERKEINVFASYARDLLDNMQGGNIALVRWVLRNDDVKGVMRHYHGRRSSGTGRTFSLARGVEGFTRLRQEPNE